MPGWDRKISPVTRDYVDDGRGSTEKTRTLATALYHQLQGERNQWVGDAAAGSDLYLIRRKDTAARMQRLKDAVITALKPFIDDGRAADLEVALDRTATGKWALRSSIRDVQSGELDIDPLMPFGP